jgi:hypothetical protein
MIKTPVHGELAWIWGESLRLVFSLAALKILIAVRKEELCHAFESASCDFGAVHLVFFKIAPKRMFGDCRIIHGLVSL